MLRFHRMLPILPITMSAPLWAVERPAPCSSGFNLQSFDQGYICPPGWICVRSQLQSQSGA
jgi:hypothetical protein